MVQSELDKRICIVGSGPASLITAHVLIRDGFRNVNIISRDRSAGGVWQADRVYPGLVTNNVYGEMEFSALPRVLPPVLHPSRSLVAEDVRMYFESYAESFLKEKIRYRTEVTNIRRTQNKMWILSIRDLQNNSKSELYYDKLVLCTGGCSIPKFPPQLSPEAAKNASYQGFVMHTMQLGTQQQKLLGSVKPLTDPTPGRAVVIGGGQSAQDTAAFLAHNGRKVSIVYDTADAFLASPSPIPDAIRRSRFISLFAPKMDLSNCLDWFLQTTWLGSLLVIALFNLFTWTAIRHLQLPKDSPLRRVHSMFWSLRITDIGNGRPDAFHRLAQAGKIELITPARVSHFGSDGHSLVLEDGRVLEADAVALGTGYYSSWDSIMDAQTREEIGMHKQLVPPAEDEWSHYRTLANPPQELRRPRNKSIMHTSFHRGIVPTKNLLNHDFAVNGALFTSSGAYCHEVVAHWIASYFRKDPFLRLPPSPAAAKLETDRIARWTDKRHPGWLDWVNESYSTDILVWAWPKQMETYFEDMRLPAYRSGGNWLTWPFKVVDIKEIAHLTEERAAVRAQYQPK